MIPSHQMPHLRNLAAAFDRANEAVKELDLSSLAQADMNEFDRRHAEYVRAGLTLAHWVNVVLREPPNGAT